MTAARRRLRVLGFFLALIIAEVAFFTANRRFDLFSSDVATSVVAAAVLPSVIGYLFFWKPPPRFSEKPYLADAALRRPSRVILRKGGQTGPRFFRDPTPIWIDFENKYIVPHPKVDSLTDVARERRSGIVLIEGRPAAGKTVLLLDLAYRLKRKPWMIRFRHVLLIQLKTTTPEMLNDILSSGPKRRIILIDDAHLQIVKLLGVIEEVAQRSLVVLATRPLTQLSVPWDQLSALMTDAVHIDVTAIDTADRIITMYLERHGYSSSDVAVAKKRLANYQSDLWALSIALLSYSPDTSVAAAVDAYVVDRMLNPEARPLCRPRSEVMITLAPFSRFEVAIRRTFLKRISGANDAELDVLVRSGELHAVGVGLLRLPHSSIAEMVLAALMSPIGAHLVPDNIRALSLKRPWGDALLLKYLDDRPEDSASVLVAVGRSTREGRATALALLDSIPLEFISRSISHQATDPTTLGSFLLLLREFRSELPSPWDQALDAYAFIGGDEVQPWVWLTLAVARCWPSHSKAFVERLAVLLAEAPVDVMADAALKLSYVDRRLGAKSMKLVSIKVLSERFQRLKLGLDDRASLAAKLVWVRKDLGVALTRQVMEAAYAGSARGMALAVSRVAWGNDEVAVSMLIACDAARLARVVQLATDDEERFTALAAIANISRPVAAEVARIAVGELSSVRSESTLAVLVRILSEPIENVPVDWMILDFAAPPRLLTSIDLAPELSIALLDENLSYVDADRILTQAQSLPIAAALLVAAAIATRLSPEGRSAARAWTRRLFEVDDAVSTIKWSYDGSTFGLE